MPTVTSIIGAIALIVLGYLGYILCKGDERG